VLAEIATAARPAGIELMPVKGVLTGHLLYHDCALRPISDADVCVRPRDLMALLAVAQRHGWAIEDFSRSYQKLVVFVRDFAVDIQALPGPPGLCGLTTETMFARSTAAHHPFGFHHRQPEFHDHLLLLVTNVFKDRLLYSSEAIWDDLHRAVEHPAFDPERFFRLVRETQTSSLAWVVADALCTDAPESRWTTVRNALEPLARSRYCQWVRRWVRGADPHPLALRLLIRSASDDPPQRAVAWSAAVAWSVERSTRRTLERWLHWEAGIAP